MEENKNEQLKRKAKEQAKKLRRVSPMTAALLLFLGFLLAAVLFILISLGMIGRSSNDRIDPSMEDFEVDTDGPDTVSPKDVEWSQVDPLNDDDLLNILLVGQDRRPGEGRQRSDSMIIVSMNPKTKEISMVSFLRDLYVRIPGYTDNRLNASYAFGGFELLKETLYANFGVTVDACFEVDFNGFESVIDAVGGVDVNLTAAEARVVGGGATEGNNHLDGEHALTYARIRKLDSDFGRTGRQRNVLMSVFEKARKSNLSELISLAKALIPQLTTDQSAVQILSLIGSGYTTLRGGQGIKSYYVPADNAYYNATIRGMMVLVPNLQMIRGSMEEYLPLNTQSKAPEAAK